MLENNVSGNLFSFNRQEEQVRCAIYQIRSEFSNLLYSRYVMKQVTTSSVHSLN